MKEIEKKLALITGGSRGLGKSMALCLAEKGHDVILTYNSRKAEADEVVAQIQSLEGKSAALQLDISTQQSFPSFAQQVERILKERFQRDRFDFLINNAGIGIHAPLEQTTEEQFDRLMNIHLKSPFFLTQRLLPLMKNGGRIVNISTGLARFTLPGYGAYAAMKGGIETLTRYQAKEFASKGITAIVVAPGAIETDFGGGVVRDNKEINKQIAESTALGRVGLPDDIGRLVAVLLSEDSRWVNGQRIEASGGIFL